MVAHFIRQFFKSALTLLLASFLIYSLAHSAVIAWAPQTIVNCDWAPSPCPDFDKINAIVKSNQLDKDWPVDYLAWLFDPNRPPGPGYFHSSDRGINITVAGLPIKGSGALT